ncbi:hypothetical protein ABH931_006296 [Streptacidiphilus sp. MAP12-33]|uniref:hypothetical protein n=1 Tax=Streptacidiphilus sp. MAP12-33 TaxID=3156266 RepID=UPI0035184692
MTTARTATPAPFRIPADFIRYAVALRAPELSRGYLTGWLSAEDTVELAFLRRCDLAEESGPFTRIKQATAAKTKQLAAVCRQLDSGDPDTERIWDYLAFAWACSRPPAEATRLLETLTASRLPLAEGTTRDPEEAGRAWLSDGRQEFLLDRAAAREGMNWDNSSALLGTDRPEEVDAAFSRREDMVGVAVIGLALTHPDPTAILPRVARALESSDQQLRHQGVVALAHVARLHRTTDPHCLELLRSWPRGNEADDDLWAYLPHRRLPPWLWRHKAAERLAWQLRNRWR